MKKIFYLLSCYSEDERYNYYCLNRLSYYHGNNGYLRICYHVTLKMTWTINYHLNLLWYYYHDHDLLRERSYSCCWSKSMVVKKYMSRKVLARKDLVFKHVRWWPTSPSWEHTWCTSSRSTTCKKDQLWQILQNSCVENDKLLCPTVARR